MQFDRAMALLFAGYKVQRSAWVRPEKNTHLKLVTEGDNRIVVMEGVEIVFTRPIPFLRSCGVHGVDMAADDWIVVPDENHAPQPNVDVEDIREQKLATLVTPDNGSPHEVLSYVLECAKAWVPEARIIGNARAGDIARAIEAIPAPQTHVVGEIPAHVRDFLGKVQGVCMGVAMSGRDHPNPDGVLMDLVYEAQEILFPAALATEGKDNG